MQTAVMILLNGVLISDNEFIINVSKTNEMTFSNLSDDPMPISCSIVLFENSLVLRFQIGVWGVG